MAKKFPEWRLRLVSVLAAVIVCVLFYRIIQVQIIRHKSYKEIALNQWHLKVKWQARRGTIFDRRGYPLAVSYKSYDIGITPADFPESEEAVKYLADVLGRDRKSIRRILKQKERYIPLAKGVNLTGEAEARLSSLSGIKIDSFPERLNPLSSIAPGFIGTIDRNGKGMGGIESAFQDDLGGVDGWLLINRDARDHTFKPVNAPGMAPIDGKDIYLTIDSRIQSIVDFELQQGVDKYGAAGGVALIVDPSNGDIIAISEKKGERDKTGSDEYNVGKLFSTSCIYEPGSTFKLITGAFLLESKMVEPYDVFYGEKGTADFEFGKFKDDHPGDWMTYKESFVHSSNICTIKAVKDAEIQKFYSFLLRIGFGSRTSIDLPAESKGRLQDPSLWSGRSLASIAIGQEIGVTPIQMAMAYCALANGGTLLVPRVALMKRDVLDDEVEQIPVIEVRRVLSPGTVETLVDFCKDVIREGTGSKAAVDGIDIAGKTGTAQKSDQYGYVDGKYVASFIGFAPAEDPRMVCLVMLDEPEYLYHYGGSSSAVIFKKIIEGVNLSTDLFVDGKYSDFAIGYKKGKRNKAPNFLRLNVSEAEELASKSKVGIVYSHDAGEVFSQIPGPGTLLSDDEQVILSFYPVNRDELAKVNVPDLTGLSIRKARRMLLECGLKSIIRGTGTVRSQSPGAGKSINAGSVIKLDCRPVNTGLKGLAMNIKNKIKAGEID
ncbi:MAG: PASTA domain-containing protein [Candidatus Krumholzibacteriota bacterium]|nr:PASTA domain-containing protein [Candidatus Krumholzibacteriota bacterium]